MNTRILATLFAAFSLAGCGSVETWGSAHDAPAGLEGAGAHVDVIARDGTVWIVGDDRLVRRVGHDGTTQVAAAPSRVVAIVDDAHMWSATADGIAVLAADGTWSETSLRDLVPSEGTNDIGRFIVTEIGLVSANDGYVTVHSEPLAADGSRRFLQYLCRGDGVTFACEDLAPIADGYRSLAVTPDAVWLYGDERILRRAHGARDFEDMGEGSLITNAGVVIRILASAPVARWDGEAFVALPEELHGILLPIDAHTTWAHTDEIRFSDDHPYAAVESVSAGVQVANDDGVRDLGGVRIGAPSGDRDRTLVPIDGSAALVCIDVRCFAVGD